MSTRAQIRFATREDGVSFSEHPKKIHAQFYCHSDGYPEGLGVEIAESVSAYNKICGWEIESLTHKHGDLDYIYYVWQAPGKETWISIFQVEWFSDDHHEILNDITFERQNKCIFVGKPEKLIQQYKLNTNEDG